MFSKLFATSEPLVIHITNNFTPNVFGMISDACDHGGWIKFDILEYNDDEMAEFLLLSSVNGYIKVDFKKDRYRVTPKGKEFVELIRMLRGMTDASIDNFVKLIKSGK